MITPTQMRAARAMLNLSQGEVASSLGIAANTLSNIEAGKSDVPASRLKEIQEYYEGKGLDFTQDEGVKKKSGDVTIYRGHEGFTEFRQLVLNAAKSGVNDICVSNVDERDFGKWGSAEMNYQYRSELAKIPNIRFRILVKEDDTYFTARNYAQYRQVRASEFGDIPFYVFGNKTAIFSFTPSNVDIFIIQHEAIANFYKSQFEANWAKAKLVEAGGTDGSAQ